MLLSNTESEINVTPNKSLKNKWIIKLPRETIVISRKENYLKIPLKQQYENRTFLSDCKYSACSNKGLKDAQMKPDHLEIIV